MLTSSLIFRQMGLFLTSSWFGLDARIGAVFYKNMRFICDFAKIGGAMASLVTSAKGVLRSAAFASLLLTASASEAEERTTLAFAAGIMSDNRIDVLYNWQDLNFEDTYLAGVIVGYDVPLRYENWSVGVEGHLHQHFGDDNYTEVIVNGIVRYTPPNPWLSVIESYGYGLGVSHTSETPAVEVRTRGDSQRTLVYMAIEAAFDVGLEDCEVFLRVHHRSDGYGLFQSDTGSNAFILGFRKELGGR